MTWDTPQPTARRRLDDWGELLEAASAADPNSPLGRLIARNADVLRSLSETRQDLIERQPPCIREDAEEDEEDEEDDDYDGPDTTNYQETAFREA
jgi:hypothetical protein